MLKLDGEALSDAQLASLWKALDANTSGFIDMGELARFLRRGQDTSAQTPAQQARQALLDSKQRARAAALAERDTLMEQHVARRAAAAGEPASAEEVRHLAHLFYTRLGESGNVDLHATVQQLFTRADRDGSGFVTHDEFTRMVRHELRLRVEDVSENKLLGLWRAIDENEKCAAADEGRVSFARRKRPHACTTCAYACLLCSCGLLRAVCWGCSSSHSLCIARPPALFPSLDRVASSHAYACVRPLVRPCCVRVVVWQRLREPG